MSRNRDPSLIPDAMPVGGISVGQLRAILRAEAMAIRDAERRETESGCAGLSLYRAARLARKRHADVRAALRSGALKGHRRGRNWVVVASAVKDWLSVGAPIRLRSSAAAKQPAGR
jgi:hypothetical protein